MKNTSYLTIKLSEDGQIIKTTVRGVTLDPSESLLDMPLKLRDLGGASGGDLGDIAIGEFKTIILIKLIRSDNSYTWLVKDPPEPPIVATPELLAEATPELLAEATPPAVALGVGCTRPPRCSFRSIRLNQDSLWIKNVPK